MTGPIPPLAAQPPAPMPAPTRAPADDTALRDTARALESQFLAIMLDAAGFGAAREAFGGGVGEAQMTSFLTEAHADAITARGGLGLSESIFQALKERGNAP